MFKKQVDSIHDRSVKRLNVLKVLACYGVEPKVLMKLYKIYIRPIIEYGSIAFTTAPKSQLDRLESIQFDAIRIALRLPKYIRKSLLNEYASIQPTHVRLTSLNTKLLDTMKTRNDHVKWLVQNYSLPNDNCNLSPLDHILGHKIPIR